ncbi:MAG: hypothetical protein C0594_16745 [Marinilabiliales bacterium]|nr:MAG: hypothetical protein C0594_16745 [Marinilabiliales bacterium]
MKKLIVLFVLSSMLSPAYCQDETAFSEKKNEINIGYFNAFDLANNNELGIGYKRTMKNGAIRFGTEFNINNSSNDHDGYKTVNNRLKLAPYLGYEFHKNYNRFQVFYGANVFASYDYTQAKYIDANTDNKEITEYLNLAYGVRPGLGLKFYINSSISITTETFINIQYTESNNKTEDADYISNRKTTGFSTNLNPLGLLSINIHF